MKHQRITLKTLRASAQPRPLITADVDKLAASIKEVGLIQPITVRAITVLNGVAESGFQIVAGHHRVAACRLLGWEEVDAIVVDTSSRLQAELIEIDENLCRSELTASQRSGFTKRRKEIWEALYPVQKEERQRVADLPEQVANTEVAQAAPPQFAGQLGGARPQEKAFAASTAAITGESKSQINRHVARAEAIGDDLPRLHGTSLDKGVELDALAKLPEPERKDLIDRAVAGEVVTARPAPASPSPKPATDCPAAYFASEVLALLDRMRSRYQCASNECAALLVSRSLDSASERAFDFYLSATSALDDFLGTAESVPQEHESAGQDGEVPA